MHYVITLELAPLIACYGNVACLVTVPVSAVHIIAQTLRAIYGIPYIIKGEYLGIPPPPFLHYC